MHEIPAHTGTFSIHITSRANRSSLLVVESYVLVDEVPNGLHQSPSCGQTSEMTPGDVFQFTVNLAVAARQQEQEKQIQEPFPGELPVPDNFEACVVNWQPGVPSQTSQPRGEVCFETVDAW